MGTGFLEVVATTALGGMPVVGARVTVLSGESILYELITDESGLTDTVALEAPAKELTLDVNFDGIPYSVCDVLVEAEGFKKVKVHDVEILDTETSILPVHMTPALDKDDCEDYYTPPHNLVSTDSRRMVVPPEMPIPDSPRVLSEVVIPEFVTVHLGRPDRAARNVRVPFTYYIKNAASHEIFATWPPASLEANIYCIISLTLNRIFTEWYRVRGHNFDITNSTQFDQMFVEGGQIFKSIDHMVDLIFNRYIRRQGHLEPFFSEYCDGRRVTCPGLWQWGTVPLAEQGMNALQILRHYYPNDVQIVETDNIGGVPESFPGFVLRPGMSGPAVRTLQTWLNRIRVNFPAIPPITNVSGVYGPQTEAAVRAFQSIRELGALTPTGVVDRATWHRLSFTYSAVKRLGELTSEGVIIGIGRTPPTDIIREGARGRQVQQAQYLLNFISEFDLNIPAVIQNSQFTRDMTNAVREFQRRYGLNPDGVIGPLTWRRLYEVYWNIRDNIQLPPGETDVIPPLPPVPPTPPPPPSGIPPYPGQLIRVGSRGADVERVQRCLNSLRGRFPSIGQLNVDGVFGPITEASVREFQRLFGLNPDGIIGPLSWNALMPECYGNPMPQYPGFLIRVGARGDYVRQIQTCLNSVNNAGLSTDGVFGPLTQAAVMNYQRANGLNPDGIVGPITWEHLFRRCAGRAAPVMAQASQATMEVAEITEIAETANNETVEVAAMSSPPPSIEYSPNFAASDLSETEYMEETLGIVAPAEGGDEPTEPTVEVFDTIPDCGCRATPIESELLPPSAEPVVVAPLSQTPPSATSPQITMNNLLMYLLICQANR
ncbi:MAG: peptidoglycan-binding protein [Defluviitaleaceae bacterium]|nr:peptidoglycan-binding protein [Defluviitaleaceae bacterium]